MKIIGNDIDSAVKNLIEEIKRTETYEQYRQQKEVVRQDAGTKAKIDELRALNYMIQNAPEDADILNESERIEDELEELCEDSRVNDFMQAELDFCRLFQDILSQLAQGIDFE